MQLLPTGMQLLRSAYVTLTTGTSSQVYRPFPPRLRSYVRAKQAYRAVPRLWRGDAVFRPEKPEQQRIEACSACVEANCWQET